MDSVARRADDLAHVEPDALETFAAELSAVARAGDRDAARLGLVPGLRDELCRPIRIAALARAGEDRMAVLHVRVALGQHELRRIRAAHGRDFGCDVIAAVWS